MEANGDVYMCDHFVYPEYLLGNLKTSGLAEMLTSERQIRFGQNKQDTLPGYCRQCKYGSICAGECPKHRIVNTPDGEPGLNYLCPGLILFFTHIAPYMEYMKRQNDMNGAPAKVMEWARRLKTAETSVNKFSEAGAYDLCPCGSGKKYKFCCLPKNRQNRH